MGETEGTGQDIAEGATSASKPERQQDAARSVPVEAVKPGRLSKDGGEERPRRAKVRRLIERGRQGKPYRGD
jgi:hypothetical protein